MSNMTRVRTDPTHSLSVKKIASGAPVPSVALLSERELQKVHELVECPAEQAKTQFHGEQAARHLSSKDREETWSNTVQASRLQKIQARNNRLEEEERRRCVIDEQEKVLQDAKRQQTLDEANTKMYSRDARVVNLNKQMLLHQVISDREQQVVNSARKRELAREANAEEGARLKQAAIEEQHEKTEQLLSARSKARAEKGAHLQQLEDLKAQRREQMQRDWEEGQELRRVADNAAAQFVQKKENTRQRNREVAVVQKQQLLEQGTPRKSPRERLEEKMVADAHDPEVAKAHEYMLRKTQDAFIAQQNRESKRELKNVKRDLAIENFVNTPRSRAEAAAEVMSSARSLSDQCCEGDEARRAKVKRGQLEYQAYVADTLAHQKHHGANSREVEQRRQAFIAQRVAEMEEEEAHERQLKRNDAQRLQYIQRLQANEKKMTQEQALSEDHKERGLLDAMQAQEDAMFNSYIQATLPASMASPLKAKAAKAPDGGRLAIY